MHFARMIFHNDFEDVQWLRDTALKLLPPLDFNSFVLHGNDDYPEKLELYADRVPQYNTKPVLVLVRREGELEKE